MRVKIEFTVDLKHEDYAAAYSCGKHYITPAYVREEIRTSAIQETMEWLGRIGVPAETNN